MNFEVIGYASLLILYTYIFNFCITVLEFDEALCGDIMLKEMKGNSPKISLYCMLRFRLILNQLTPKSVFSSIQTQILMHQYRLSPEKLRAL